MAFSEEINLVSGTPRTFKHVIIRWSLSFGRVIVVTIQALVILMLVYKLNLYNKLVDVDEDIEEKVAIVHSFDSVEKDVRDVQLRVKSLRELKAKSFNFAPYIDFMDKEVPPTVIVKDSEFYPALIKISAEATTAGGFGTAVENFISNKSVREIVLTKAVYNAENGTYSFNLTIRFKNDIKGN